MEPMRVFVDTSVFGGCLDEEFKEDSRRLVEAVRRGRLVALLTDIVIEELREAPRKVRAILESLPPRSVERIALGLEILELRDAYVRAGIVGERYRNDAAHVAAATVAGADAIVSWNFQHIVRLDKMKAYNRVNLEKGYANLTIVTPTEVVGDVGEEAAEGV